MVLHPPVETTPVFGKYDRLKLSKTDLGDNEYLFNSEGFSIGSGGTDMITLFTNTNPSVRAFTVGELCEAIREAPSIG
jgi:hypothetical protein